MKISRYQLCIARFAFVSVLCIAQTASAHQSSFTYGALDFSASDRFSYSLRIDSRDLFEALSLDKDRDATDEEITAGSAALYKYVDARTTVVANVACEVQRAPVRVTKESTRLAELRYQFLCKEPVERVSFEYQLFFELDALHVGILRIGDDTVQFKKDNRTFVYEVGTPPPSGVVGFIGSGVDHILFGLDHVLFLASLLLMVVLIRREEDLEVRPFKQQLLYTGGIVTSFTVAHSLTLIAAGLGWVELPGAFVESVIAASIVYVAVENVVRPDPPHRYVITFLFGLIHGLGFASMLRPLLPAEDIVLPLLAFNVGVELGQLGIVVVVLPLLFLLAKTIGARQYRSKVLPITTCALSVIGAIWLVERAFGLEILGL